jgi:hypothetical protein
MLVCRVEILEAHLSMDLLYAWLYWRGVRAVFPADVNDGLLTLV